LLFELRPGRLEHVVSKVHAHSDDSDAADPVLVVDLGGDFARDSTSRY